MTRTQREIDRILTEMLEDIIFMNRVARIRFHNAYRYHKIYKYKHH